MISTMYAGLRPPLSKERCTFVQTAPFIVSPASRKYSDSLRGYIEESSQDLSTTFHLHKNPIVARLRNAVRECDFGGQGCSVPIVPGVRVIGVLTCDRECRHRHRARWMNVSKDRTVAADKGGVAGHPHV